MPYVQLLFHHYFPLSVFFVQHETHENAEDILQILDIAMQVFYIQEAMKRAIGQILALC